MQKEQQRQEQEKFTSPPISLRKRPTLTQRKLQSKAAEDFTSEPKPKCSISTMIQIKSWLAQGQQSKIQNVII